MVRLELPLGDRGSMPSGTAKSFQLDAPGHENTAQRQFLHGMLARPVAQHPDPARQKAVPADQDSIRACSAWSKGS
jgi:hypothetical protein